MNKAKNLLAALEAEISGATIDEQGTPVVDEPKEEPHENPAPTIPELPAQDKYLIFLALMRDVLGHEGYDKFLVDHATELEVYNLIPNAEKTMISHKHLHSEREEMTPSEKEAAVALARAAGDPMYESLVSAERAVGDALKSITDQYGGDIAKDAVKKTLDEVGQKMNAVDFDGADTIRHVIGTVAKRYITPAAADTDDDDEIDSDTSVAENPEVATEAFGASNVTMDQVKKAVQVYATKKQIDTSATAMANMKETVKQFNAYMKNQKDTHVMKTLKVGEYSVLVYTINGVIIEVEIPVVGKKKLRAVSGPKIQKLSAKAA